MKRIYHPRGRHQQPVTLADRSPGVSGWSAAVDSGRMLNATHAHARDALVRFHDANGEHYYTVEREPGVLERVPVSVTAFTKAYFVQFDADKMLNRYYSKWSADANSKYHSLIHATLSAGGDAEAAREAIKAQWKRTGTEASARGTQMHAHAEIMMNGLVAPDTPEMTLLGAWRREFQPEMRWVPHRTEWTLWWEDQRCDNALLVAGTLDLLMRSETTGDYGLFDFKRTNPAPKFAGDPQRLLGPWSGQWWHPGQAAPPLHEVEDTDFGKYTMQLNILSKMLLGKYGIDVGQHMYLVQIHEDLPRAHTQRVDRMTNATNSLFNIEAEKLRLQMQQQ